MKKTKPHEAQDFTVSILLDQPPKEVFAAITNPLGWWSEEIKGGTKKINDEFTYHYEDVHRCKMRLVEVIPEKRVVWLVLDNFFAFTKDKAEWKNTMIFFEIQKRGTKTHLRFTHEGLVPEFECYDVCHKAWAHYIQKSLLSLIATGKGLPNKKEEKAA